MSTMFDFTDPNSVSENFNDLILEVPDRTIFYFNKSILINKNVH